MSEEEIFRALSHEKRRNVVRCLGEIGSLTFSEIRTHTGIHDTPILSYYLRTLRPLLKQEGDRYYLSESGRDAFSLILRSSSFPQEGDKKWRERIPWLIIGNAVLWACAIYLISMIQSTGSERMKVILILGGFSFASILLNSQLEKKESVYEKWEKAKSLFK
jgi:hypothetical protein